MKQGIHPDYMDCTVKCSCGNTFQTRSTKPELKIDICNVCHPFFTGQQKLIDTGGRVQRFADRFGSAREAVAAREAAKKAEHTAEVEAAEAKRRAEREAKAAQKADRAAAYAAKADKATHRAEAESAMEAAEGVLADIDLVEEVFGAEMAVEVVEVVEEAPAEAESE
ncbi:MAG: 50S ribosomal protein L31 [Eggerthellaceae bacterium]|nr:50S ribosomal protein L31 [Eggerthellaceae bacterium]